MRRRVKIGRKAVKARRPKASARRNALKATRRHSLVAAGKELDAARLARDLKEARAQQTATREILASIAGSKVPRFGAHQRLCVWGDVADERR
jgi:hypothetical protein